MGDSYMKQQKNCYLFIPNFKNLLYCNLNKYYLFFVNFIIN